MCDVGKYFHGCPKSLSEDPMYQMPEDNRRHAVYPSFHVEEGGSLRQGKNQLKRPNDTDLRMLLISKCQEQYFYELWKMEDSLAKN
jgi:hypothetical protein